MKFFRFLFKFFNNLRLFILNVVFFGLIIAVIFLLIPDEKVVQNKGQKIDNSVIQINLNGHLNWENLPSFSEDESQLTLQQLRELLYKAKDDNNIVAVSFTFGSFFSSSLANLQDLASFIVAFKETGKTVLAYSDDFNQSSYYLASYADSIALSPMGSVFFKGFSSQRVFFGNFLAKHDIKPDIIKEGNYKSAVEPYMRNNFSPESYENTRLWISDLWTQYLTTVAANRDKDIDAMVDYSRNYAPLLIASNGTEAAFALEQKLIDEIVTAQDWKDRSSYLADSNYLASNPASQLGNNIAVIPIRGTLAPKTSSFDWENNDGKEFAKNLNDAVTNKKMKAILIMVDSPGGSVNIAEEIRLKVEKATQSDKPIAVYFSSVAASGGYWLSMPVTNIIASPAAITGSIGVFAILPQLTGFTEKLGISSQTLATTPYSDIYNPLSPLNEQQRSLLDYRVQQTYQQFLAIVSVGRSLSPQTVPDLAGGRVYSGRKAAELGLVSSTGSFNDALDSLATDIDSNTLGRDYKLAFYNTESEWSYELLQFLQAEVIQPLAKQLLKQTFADTQSQDIDSQLLDEVQW